jgi:hypothetical protein
MSECKWAIQCKVKVQQKECKRRVEKGKLSNKRSRIVGGEHNHQCTKETIKNKKHKTQL